MLDLLAGTGRRRGVVRRRARQLFPVPGRRHGEGDEGAAAAGPEGVVPRAQRATAWRMRRCSRRCSKARTAIGPGWKRSRPPSAMRRWANWWPTWCAPAIRPWPRATRWRNCCRSAMRCTGSTTRPRRRRPGRSREANAYRQMLSGFDQVATRAMDLAPEAIGGPLHLPRIARWQRCTGTAGPGVGSDRASPSTATAPTG